MDSISMPKIGILRTAALTYPIVFIITNMNNNQHVSVLFVAITPSFLFDAKPPPEAILSNWKSAHMGHISIKVQLVKLNISLFNQTGFKVYVNVGHFELSHAKLKDEW